MKCALCKAPIFGYGHNGQPLTNDRVCDLCNDIYVIRLACCRFSSESIRPCKTGKSVR
jgi:hypothetical protein